MATKTAPPVGYLDLVRQNREYRLLWIGQIVSLLGDWFNLIASASLIALLTQSGAAVGGLFVVRMLAPFLVSPFAGVAADRYNRKHLLIITDIVRGLTVLGFLFIRSPEQVWLVYVLTAIQMGVSGVFFPTKNAILPDVTKPNELGTANALSSSTWSVMLSVGAALGGLSSGIFGVYPSFVLDAATFFVSAIVLSRMVYTPPPELTHSDKTVRAALRQYIDGINYLRKDLDILIISLHKAANSLLVAGAFQVLQVSIAEQRFPIGEGGGISLGLMYMAVGIGTGLGPIIARMFTGDRERALRMTLMFTYLISALGLLIVSTMASFPVVLFGTLLRGIGAGTGWVFSTQLLLMLVPDQVRGRVFATEYAGWTLMNAIAAGTAGTLLDGGFSDVNVLHIMATGALFPGLLWGLWIFFGKPQHKMRMQAGD